jgi:hypothetical protein
VKKLLLIFSSAICIVFGNSTASLADQTVSVDLNNFNDDGLGLNYPNTTISGVNDGDVITINVSNATQGFLGYINDGAGNGINVNNGAAVNINSNTGQFFGAGTLSSLVYDNTIVGSYTVTLTIGANSILSRGVATEADVADETSDSNNAVGWLVLEWRQGMVNAANWKQISIVQSGVAASIPSSHLMVSEALSASMKDNSFTCTPGTYKMASSEVNVSSFIYKLYLNNQLVSTVVNDAGRIIPATMLQGAVTKLPGTLTGSSLTWDTSAFKDYTAHCEITAFASSSSSNSSSETFADSAYKARVAAAAQAWEDQRSAATAANFTKDMREMRKRLAARQP